MAKHKRPSKNKARQPVDKRSQKINLEQAISLFTIKCSCCGRKTEIHAYGKNKRTMRELGTTRPIISSACWNDACTSYGKEIKTIDEKGI